MKNNREAMTAYADQRIEITGLFVTFGSIMRGQKYVRTALLQDAFAEVDGKEIDIDHVWLQNADPLKNLNLSYGDRIRCNCRVSEYTKQFRVPNKDGRMFEKRVSFAWPTEVQVINRLTRTAVTPVVSQHQSSPGEAMNSDTNKVGANSPLSLILEVQVLASRVGGLDELSKLIEVLRTGSRLKV